MLEARLELLSKTNMVEGAGCMGGDGGGRIGVLGGEGEDWIGMLGGEGEDWIGVLG